MATQTLAKRVEQVVPRENAAAFEWTVPDTVHGLQQELGSLDAEALDDYRTLWALSQPLIMLVGAGASIAPLRLSVIAPTSMEPSEQVAVEVETGTGSSHAHEGMPNAAQVRRTADGRFVVDPEAMSQLVDWAMDQDFGPDAGDEIRRDAWH